LAIVPRKTRYGISYQAMYRFKGKQYSAGTCADRKDAEAKYFEAMALVRRGIDPKRRKVEEILPDDVRGKITLKAFADRWLPKHDVSHNVRVTYASALRLHIVPQFGAMPLSDIGAGDIAEFIREIDRRNQPALTAKVRAVMSALFTAAAEDKNIPEVRVNPVRGTKTKRHPHKRRIAFEREEFEKFRAELDGHWTLLVDFITIHTGVRWEEAMGLKKSDVVSLGAGKGAVVHIEATLHELKSPHRWEYAARTKTGRSRQIKISQAMADRIAERPDGFLFLDPAGDHIRVDKFRRPVWRPALKAIGLEDSGLVPRDMRRTHATMLRKAGASLEVVSKRLGHTNLLTTQAYLAEPSDTEDVAVGLIDWE
jgi:integrase